MKKIYSAANLPEAHLLLHELAERGIRARILNANAAGAIGELPIDSAAPQIWIDDAAQAERAREVIHGFIGRAAHGPPRRCRACGEENPPAFETCWSCGRVLPD